MSGVSVEVIDPRTDPEPDGWEKLRRTAGLWANWSYELVRIAAWTSRSPMLLTVLRVDGAPVGVVCARWLGLPGNLRSYARRSSAWFGPLDVRAPLSTAHPGWWFDPELGPESHRDLFDAYRRQMRRALGVRCQGVLWRQVSERDLPLIGRVRLARPTDEIAVLRTPWDDAEGWLRGLSKSRRGDLRRQRRRLAEEPRVVGTIGPGDDIDPAELAALVRNTELKYNEGWRTPPPTPATWLEGMLTHPEVLAGSFRDGSGRLLANMFVLDHPEWPILGTWAALSPEEGGRRHVYFEGIYQLVEWAVANGKRGLIYGKTHMKLKRDLGSDAVPQYAVAVLR